MIVAQHTLGIPCEIDIISIIAKKNNIILIEDCALSIGSDFKGICLGNFGDFAIFSFDHSKPINAFAGGVVYTRNKDYFKDINLIQNNASALPQEYQNSIKFMYKLEQRLDKLNNYSFFKFISRVIILLSKLRILSLKFLSEDFSANDHCKYPYPALMPPFCAKVALKELSVWSITKNIRRLYYKNYIKILLKKNICLPKAYFDTNNNITPLRLIFTVNQSKKISFEKMFDKKWYWFKSPIVETSDDLREFGYTQGDCPVAEFVGKRIINLPCNQNPYVMKKIFRNI